MKWTEIIKSDDTVLVWITGKLALLYTVGGSVNWKTCMKDSLSISIKIINAYILWPRNSTPRNVSYRYTPICVTWCIYKRNHCSFFVIVKPETTTMFTKRGLDISTVWTIKGLKRIGRANKNYLQHRVKVRMWGAEWYA